MWVKFKLSKLSKVASFLLIFFDDSQISETSFSSKCCIFFIQILSLSLSLSLSLLKISFIHYECLLDIFHVSFPHFLRKITTRTLAFFSLFLYLKEFFLLQVSRHRLRICEAIIIFLSLSLSFSLSLFLSFFF